MKQKNLASILAVTLSFELMVSPLLPLAHAADEKEKEKEKEKDAKQQAANVINSTSEAVAVGIQAIGNIWNSVNQQRSATGMTPQVAGDMARLKDQQTPQPDKYFNPNKLMQMPGLANYLALNNINPAMLDCKTLPTTLHEAKPEVCRIGITNDKGMNQQMQLNQMFTYYNQYFQVSKMYQNFSADSNSDGQAFGIGCMNNAMNILNGFFKYRLDELDKLTTNLEAMQNQFREASRSDLDAIEESVAVLEGESDIADKVRSKKPDLFDFAKRFDNPACNSMFAGEALNEKGRAGGLNSINSDLKKTLTAKNGKYSGESYSKAHTAVVEDLNNLADKVSKQLELNFGVLSKDPGSYGKFLADLPDLVTSPNGSNRALSPDLFSDVRTKFNENYVKLNEQRSTVLNELRSAGISGDAATTLLGNTNSSNFDSEVVSIENRLKNKCLESTLDDIDKDKLMDKIYDPSASGHANKFASNFLKDKLNKILENKDSSLEKKLSELKALESQTGSRYYLKMENSYEVQDVDQEGKLNTRVVDATSVRTPSVFFSDLIKNCNAQFKANKLDNKLSGSSAIQKLRQLNQDYKALAKSQASDMKKEIRKKLVECSSPEEANNTVPGSCTSERFNTSAPGFCANAAFSCSKNMQACSQQADGFVKQIKEQKTARVNNYKALVQKNKQDIVKIFDSALTRYMKDGEMMRGIFGAGFSSPAGIKREVPEGQRYLGEFAEATGRSPDGKLLLEDPDKYVEMFKGNIALLKESVKKQQDQILGGDSVGKNPGLLADHIKKTKKNYDTVVKDANRIAEECRNNHDGAVKAAEAQRGKQQEEYQKKMTELGEKREEFCNLYGMARTNPQAACGELESGLIKDSLRGASMAAGNQAEARDDVAKLTAYCSQYGNFDEKKSGGPISADELCMDMNAEKPIFLKTQAIKDKVTALCNDRETFKAGSDKCTVKGANVPAGSTVTSDCNESYKQTSNQIEAAYAYSKRASNPEIDIELSEAPAYCMGTSNSPSRLPKMIEAFGNAFANTPNPSAGRQ